MNSSSRRVPARTSSLSRQTSVPHPSGRPLKVPVSIGPPGTTRAGRSTDAAAISSAGIVLSQPPSRTTPSMGLARNSSSADIAARLRQSIAVGTDLGLAEREDGQVEGHAAGLPDAALHVVGDLVEVGVARAQVRRRVGDGDLRSPVECVAGKTPAHPRPVDVGVAVIAAVPLRAAPLSFAIGSSLCDRRTILADIMAPRASSMSASAARDPCAHSSSPVRAKPPSRTSSRRGAGPGRGGRRRRARRAVRHRCRVLHRRDGLPAPGPCRVSDPARARVVRDRDARSATGWTTAWLGRRTTGDTMLPCHRCERCRDGRGHLCEDRSELGIRGGWPGRPGRAGRGARVVAPRPAGRGGRRGGRARRTGRERVASRAGAELATGQPRPHRRCRDDRAPRRPVRGRGRRRGPRAWAAPSGPSPLPANSRSGASGRRVTVPALAIRCGHRRL